MYADDLTALAAPNLLGVRSTRPSVTNLDSSERDATTLAYGCAGMALGFKGSRWDRHVNGLEYDCESAVLRHWVYGWIHSDFRRVKEFLAQ